MDLVKSKIAKSWAVDADTWPEDNPDTMRQQMDDVLVVFQNCCGTDALLERKVIVSNGNNEDYPITYPKRRPENAAFPEDYMVYLFKTSNDPLRFFYQASHEFGHVLMKCYPDNDCFKWIAECLCALSTFYVMERIADMHPQRKDDIERYLKAPKDRPLKIKKTFGILSKYYSAKMPSLINDPNEEKAGKERPRNDAIALWLLEIVENNPLGWKSILHMDDSLMRLKTEAKPNNQTMKEYFRHWLSNCNSAAEKRFVSATVKMLGIRI